MNPFLIMKPLGESYGVTVSNTATTLPTIPDGAIRCILQVETQDIRVKFNNTNSVTYGVTAGSGGGLLLPVNTIACPYYVIEGRDNLDRMRMYRGGSTNSFVNVIFQGESQPTAYTG